MDSGQIHSVIRQAWDVKSVPESENNLQHQFIITESQSSRPDLAPVLRVNGPRYHSDAIMPALSVS